MEQRDPEHWADAIRSLAPWAAAIRVPGFSFGTWHEMERRDDGVTTMPWFELSADGRAMLTAAGPLLLTDFDWPAWTQTDEALRLRDEPDAIAAASPRQIAQLLTALIRQDRFVEGAVDAAMTSGLLGRLLDRVAELAGEMGRTAR